MIKSAWCLILTKNVGKQAPLATLCVGMEAAPTLPASRSVVVSQITHTVALGPSSPAVTVIPGEMQGGGVFTAPRGRRQRECLPQSWGSTVFGENTFQTMDTAWGTGGRQGAFNLRNFLMLGNFKNWPPPHPTPRRGVTFLYETTSHEKQQ